MKACATDTEWAMKKPYETESDSFTYWAICLRNNVAINPVLNYSKAVKEELLGWHH